MNTTESKKIIYYGISCSSAYPITIEEQKVLFRLFFFTPSVSYEKAKMYLTDPFYFHHSDVLKKNLADEIALLTAEVSQETKKFHLELQLINKLEKWITGFSLPTPDDIAELAQALSVSEINIYRGIYRFYLKEDLSHKQITEYLYKYAEIISERLVNKMLDKLLQTKTEKNQFLKKLQKTLQNPFF